MPPLYILDRYSQTTWSNRESATEDPCANVDRRREIYSVGIYIEGRSRPSSLAHPYVRRRRLRRFVVPSRIRRARAAVTRFRARKLFLFIAPFSAGRPRLNHCAFPYWMGWARCMVYSRPPLPPFPIKNAGLLLLLLPLRVLRPSSLTTVNKVSNIPFDRTPIAEGGRERKVRKDFFSFRQCSPAALKALTWRNISLFFFFFWERKEIGKSSSGNRSRV